MLLLYTSVSIISFVEPAISVSEGSGVVPITLSIINPLFLKLTINTMNGTAYGECLFHLVLQ